MDQAGRCPGFKWSPVTTKRTGYRKSIKPNVSGGRTPLQCPGREDVTGKGRTAEEILLLAFMLRQSSKNKGGTAE